MDNKYILSSVLLQLRGVEWVLPQYVIGDHLHFDFKMSKFQVLLAFQKVSYELSNPSQAQAKPKPSYAVWQ